MSKANENHGLGAFFEAARKAAPQPDAPLMERVLADAAKVQADLTAQNATPVARSSRLWLAIAENLGGWRGMSALTACACTGLWIGFSTPEFVDSYSGGLLTAEPVDTLDFADLYGFEDMLTES